MTSNEQQALLYKTLRVYLDVHESVYRDTTMENNQQDALYRLTL